jgi:hypothetical protein
MKKHEKRQKKVFWSSDLLRKGHSFLCQAQQNGPWVSKDAEFKVDFKNINLP